MKKTIYSIVLLTLFSLASQAQEPKKELGSRRTGNGLQRSAR